MIILQKIIYGAVILLIIQVGLIVAVNSRQSDFDTSYADSFFAEIKADKVSELNVTDNEGKSVTLIRGKNGWVMKNAYAAPADSKKVEDLLSRLASSRKGLAVATTAGAARRFKTAAAEFERHIVIKDKENVLADFFIGTSAGVKSSHVRKAGEDAVFTIGVGGYEFSARPSDWLDANLAKIEREKVKQIEINGLTITRTENSWMLTVPQSEKIDSKQATSLLDSITGLTVQDVFDPADVSRLFETDASTQFVVTLDSGEKITYALAKKDDDYVLKMSGSDLYFKVMAWQVDDLLKFNLETVTSGDLSQGESSDVTPIESPQS